MKPLMMFSIVAVAGIILAAAFGLRVLPMSSPLPAGMNTADILFVCPAENQSWVQIADILRPASRQIIMAFCFVAMLLLFAWGWALYQNLLKDKFVGDAYKKPWKMTKAVFWLAMVMILLTMTPNYFRRVQISGAPGNWVLCEESDLGARAVRANAVRP